MPTNYWFSPETLAGPIIGPALNATNVPLDTTVVIDQMRPIFVGELQMLPETHIARRVDEYHSLASRATIFYFSEPLKPATNYNATIFLKSTSISWNFTTTSESYYPRYEAWPSGLGIFVAVTVSLVVTSVVGLRAWKKKKEENTTKIDGTNILQKTQIATRGNFRIRMLNLKANNIRMRKEWMEPRLQQ